MELYLLPPYEFMAWYLNKHRDNFTYTSLRLNYRFRGRIIPNPFQDAIEGDVPPGAYESYGNLKVGR
jgi:hypothetical protein